MRPDHDPDEEPTSSGAPLPPEDRLWRHPSELGAGINPPAAWLPPPATTAPQTPARTLGVGALVGACLAGVVVAVGAMWLVRPRSGSAPEAASTVTLVAADAGRTAARSGPVAQVEELAEQFAASLPAISVRTAGGWILATGAWLDDGAVLTSAPLVADAAEILVAGRDGRTRAATVAGTDPSTGIAVLRSEGDSHTSLDRRVGPARSGQEVAVLSAPASTLGSSVLTRAEIGETGQRCSVGTAVVHDCFHLDQPLEPTDTGGLVVDGTGRLLGIVLTSGGLNPAAVLPGATALDVADQLQEHGEVDRAWLGVRATDLDAGQLRLLHGGGARLTEVTPGSPAALAGLKVGDVITAIDGTPLADTSALVLALQTRQRGERAELTVLVDGVSTTVVVPLG